MVKAIHSRADQQKFGRNKFDTIVNICTMYNIGTEIRHFIPRMKRFLFIWEENVWYPEIIDFSFHFHFTNLQKSENVSVKLRASRRNITDVYA